jgi:hypothetical protein
MKLHAQQSIAKAVFEALEGRQCMSATIGLHDGVLTLRADPSMSANMTVEMSGGREFITASVANQQQTFLAGPVKSLVLIGSTQSDYIYVDPHLGLSAQITANGGNDTIWGGSGADVIQAGDGNDLIHAGGTITLGAGNDTVWGSGARDTIYAGSGDDLIVGGPGHDVIYGGSGNDTLIAGGGTDKIVAGSGDNIIYGSAGNDTLIDGTGSDTIYGGGGGNNVVVSSNKTVVHAQYATTVKTRPAKQPGGTGTGQTTGTTTAPVTKPAVTPSPIPTPVPTPPVSTSASAPKPVISQLETSVITGEGVNVNALSSAIKHGTALTTTYNWNFGDAGSEYNNLTGWNAGHVYDNPGTYTITLTMTDDAGLTSVATSQVTVNPDTRPVIYVDTNGSDANSGATPAQAVQTAMKAVQLAGSNVKILFKRGETFNVNTDLFLAGHDIYVGAYGTGANPVLNRVTGWDDVVIFCEQNSSNITIQNLTFDSPNAVASGPAPEIGVTPVWAWGTDVVVRDDMFLNVETAVSGSMQPSGVIVQDNSAPLLTGLRGYFCWVDGNNWTIVGNNVANTTRQHVIRSNDPNTTAVLIADNNLSKVLRADDPAEVQKTTINFRGGTYIYITNNTLNYGTVAFGPDALMPQASSATWIVVQDNYFNAAPLWMTGATDHVLVQNNYFDDPNMPSIQLIPTDDTYPTTRLMHDITITDNTSVNTGIDGQFLLMSNAALPGTITLTNNLYIAPTLRLENDGDAALTLDAPDLSSFTQISGNIWPAPNSYGGVNYLAGYTSPSSYLTPAEWDQESKVSDDQFAGVSLPAGTYQITINGVTAGATGFTLSA